MCTTGCAADRGYALVRDNKLFRFTFSRSLADHVALRSPGTRVVPARVRSGEELRYGARSPTGLYSVCKTASRWPLRVTLFPELADLWRDPSRVVCVCYLDLDD